MRMPSAGSEYVDMECCWSLKARETLVAGKQASLMIGSHHLMSRTVHPTMEELLLLFKEAAHEGRSDVAKVITRATCLEDNMLLRAAAKAANLAIPVIAIAAGTEGKLSRVLNGVLTPVTHPKLPVPAAPGQLSVQEINATLQALGLLSPRDFFLVGYGISASPSPLMHNTGFRAFHLPHTYALCDDADVSVAVSRMRKVRAP